MYDNDHLRMGTRSARNNKGAREQYYYDFNYQYFIINCCFNYIVMSVEPCHRQIPRACSLPLLLHLETYPATSDPCRGALVDLTFPKPPTAHPHQDPTLHSKTTVKLSYTTYFFYLKLSQLRNCTFILNIAAKPSTCSRKKSNLHPSRSSNLLFSEPSARIYSTHTLSLTPISTRSCPKRPPFPV
jgi:hypothetical protein